ncbi:hypothetical protein MKQ70_28970 [Chitinophaga sedimenti]|uniref:hypothetical protein n=1 Tax=Chitinophaga sedimenti TaxID=2033606 RepID=UPI002005A99E|nr:hypothetical protein [Chitinophaga sedimenti]MCK7558798.1 hypothetical protein [Chitinophaga sedimenti]
MHAFIYESGSLIWILLLVVISIILQLLLLRWAMRVNDMIFYLDKINEKLFHLLEEKKKENKEDK